MCSALFLHTLNIIMHLLRQSRGASNVEGIQRLQEHAAKLKMKVMEYEKENQQLRSDLDMSVCLQYSIEVATVNVASFMCYGCEQVRMIVIFMRVCLLAMSLQHTAFNLQGKATPDNSWHYVWSDSEDSRSGCA